MQIVISKLLYEIEHHKDTCLVTLVADRGSAPRAAGARMLVGAKGRLVGSIGGGALEKRAEELALTAIAEKCSLLREFSLRAEGSGELSMVCGGEVSVLFQFISHDNSRWAALAEALAERLRQRKTAWLIHPLDGSAPTLCDEEPSMTDGKSVFTERVNCGERLVIFGAGHIARALVPLAVTVGFRPVVFDNRPEYAAESFFPGAEQVICAPYEDIAAEIQLTAEDYVVIMTNGHSHDLTVQRQVMDSDAYAYLGVIGSRAKTAVLNKALLEHGIAQEALDAVHTPIGTAIRAVTPEEIAVSIVGELILVRANRCDGK